jgi:sugar phosphate isomerase/epimerase
VTIELALTPDHRWPYPTAEVVAAARTAGFVACGISAEAVDADAVTAYASAGIRCHEVMALFVGEDEDVAAARAEELAHVAASIGSTWVLTVFAAAEVDRSVARCAEKLADEGVAMAVEFSPLGPISSIPDGMNMVHAARRSGARAGLMIDSWHFCFGDSTWADLEGVPLDDIAYVQFSDASAAVPASLASQTMHHRALPGEGVLELDRFARTLLRRGWQGLVSVEVLSAELRKLPVHELTRRLYATSAPFWGLA